MKLELTPRALAELHEILAYISAHSPDASQRVQKRIRDTFEIVRLRPNLGRLSGHPRLRCIRATPYRYLVFYEPRPETVVIVGVRHEARDPASMPDA